MKKIIYLLSVLFLTFTACQEETLLEVPGGEDTGTLKEESLTVNFGLDIPTFSVATKAGDVNVFGDAGVPVNSLDVFTFDAEGKFLGNVRLLGEGKSASKYDTFVENDKSGTVVISTKTAIIHFLINYEGSLTGFSGTETTIIPSLETTQFGYWGRVEVSLSDLKNTVRATLIRNFAWLTFKDEATDFGIVNAPQKATLATFGETDEEKKDFTPVKGVVTLPATQSYSNKAALQQSYYILETPNAINTDAGTPLYVIVNQGNKYYKIQLVKSAFEAWELERNYKYTIDFENFELATGGYDSFEGAAGGDIANNVFAEIIKTAPGIMDAAENRLEVEKMAFQYTRGTEFQVGANYYVMNEEHKSIKDNSYIQVRIRKGADDGVVELLGYDAENGKILGKALKDGVTYIQVYETLKNVLLRDIEITVSDGFVFIDPSLVNEGENKVKLTFTIPDIDPAFFPLRVKIRTKNLSPLNAKLYMEYDEDGEVIYVYEATAPGTYEVPFFGLSEAETVLLMHENFQEVELDYIPEIINGIFLDIRDFNYFRFTNNAGEFLGASTGNFAEENTFKITYNDGNDVAYISFNNYLSVNPLILPDDYAGDVRVSITASSNRTYEGVFTVAQLQEKGVSKILSEVVNPELSETMIDITPKGTFKLSTGKVVVPTGGKLYVAYKGLSYEEYKDLSFTIEQGQPVEGETFSMPENVEEFYIWYKSGSTVRSIKYTTEEFAEIEEDTDKVLL
ncbi:hypothetical protein [Parabacteroides sp. PF5-6]|uniref:hypothetical protein n=1 Tax=Parabacteroides sp. PF5-6 TaxID=1742403 RepID=UPI002405B270|nr:hypothetical protein [Parabacteroides sp. PF5-6]MDF9829905.1 hypothetical protein [Parabacteroides sp. PF5-6]